MKQRLIAILVLALVIGLAGLSFSARSDAAPNAVPDAARTDVGGQGSEITLVAPAVHTGSGTSDWKCDEGQFTEFVTELTISGTMTGTNPTDAISIEHSIDHGTSVAGTVNSFTTINATVTPAVQTDVRLNGVVIANTPVAYG